MRLTLEATPDMWLALCLTVDRAAHDHRRLSMHTNKSHDRRRIHAEAAGELERFAAQLREKMRHGA